MLIRPFQEGGLEDLCRRFLESRDSTDERLRERVQHETQMSFDILLEVMSSVYMLEPFNQSQVGCPVLAVTLPLGHCCVAPVGPACGALASTFPLLYLPLYHVIFKVSGC